MNARGEGASPEKECLVVGCPAGDKEWMVSRGHDCAYYSPGDPVDIEQ